MELTKFVAETVTFELVFELMGLWGSKKRTNVQNFMAMLNEGMWLIFFAFIIFIFSDERAANNIILFSL